ncbi:hypothetical protein T10_10184 [Trichinella papuae]|uniref:Uncharacterized protein n=1 Tax=Trichinella papuae TaxID=268474 RepID=A0A0V1N7T5_9BILA|nr:hypothetical protein T10_10184 [Trichinella papuae]
MDLEILKRRRKVLKGRTVRLCRDLYTFVHEARPHAETSRTIDALSKYLEHFQNAHGAMEVTTDDAEERKMTSEKCGIRRLTMAKLSTRNLAKFSGNVLEFLSCWEHFKAGIHGIIQLEDVSKFIYLPSILEGERLKAMKRVSLVIEHHIQALLDVRPNEKRKLRDLHGELLRHVRSLEKLGRRASENEYASDFILTISKRLLPETILRQWEDKNHNGISKYMKSGGTVCRRGSVSRTFCLQTSPKEADDSTATFLQLQIPQWQNLIDEKVFDEDWFLLFNSETSKTNEEAKSALEDVQCAPAEISSEDEALEQESPLVPRGKGSKIEDDKRESGEVPIDEALNVHEWNVSVDASSLIAGGQSIESAQEAKVALNEPVIEKEKHSGHENVLDSNTWLRSFLLNEGIYYAFSAMILLIAPHIMSGWAVYVVYKVLFLINTNLLSKQEGHFDK